MRYISVASLIIIASQLTACVAVKPHQNAPYAQTPVVYGSIAVSADYSNSKKLLSPSSHKNSKAKGKSIGISNY